MTDVAAASQPRPAQVHQQVQLPADDGGGPMRLLGSFAAQGPFAVLAMYLIWQQAATAEKFEGVVAEFRTIHTEDMAQLRSMDERHHGMSVQQIELLKESRDELRRIRREVPGSVAQ